MDYDKNTVIAEVAGKDSIAAIIKYAQDNKGCYMLPTIIKVPSEEARHEDLMWYYRKLQRYIWELGSHLYDPVFIDASYEWWEINKPISKIINSYGFYTPCIACHGLVHAVRIPMAKDFCGKILTGERVSHGGRVKINQNTMVLDIFDKMFDKYGVEMIRPFGGDSEEIDDIINRFHESCNIMSVCFVYCNMSGNSDVRTEDDLAKYKIREYCEKYLMPELYSIIGECKK